MMENINSYTKKINKNVVMSTDILRFETITPNLITIYVKVGTLHPVTTWDLSQMKPCQMKLKLAISWPGLIWSSIVLPAINWCISNGSSLNLVLICLASCDLVLNCLSSNWPGLKWPELNWPGLKWLSHTETRGRGRTEGRTLTPGSGSTKV